MADLSNATGKLVELPLSVGCLLSVVTENEIAWTSYREKFQADSLLTI